MVWNGKKHIDLIIAIKLQYVHKNLYKYVLNCNWYHSVVSYNIACCNYTISLCVFIVLRQLLLYIIWTDSCCHGFRDHITVDKTQHNYCEWFYYYQTICLSVCSLSLWPSLNKSASIMWHTTICLSCVLCVSICHWSHN